MTGTTIVQWNLSISTPLPHVASSTRFYFRNQAYRLAGALIGGSVPSITGKGQVCSQWILHHVVFFSKTDAVIGLDASVELSCERNSLTWSHAVKPALELNIKSKIELQKPSTNDTITCHWWLSSHLTSDKTWCCDSAAEFNWKFRAKRARPLDGWSFDTNYKALDQICWVEHGITSPIHHTPSYNPPPPIPCLDSLNLLKNLIALPALLRWRLLINSVENRRMLH